MATARKRLSNDGETESKKKKIIELPVNEDSEAHKRILKHENLTENEFLIHWKACQNDRLNLIKSAPVSEVINIWPYYKQPNGYKLVSSEYLFHAN